MAIGDFDHDGQPLTHHTIDYGQYHRTWPYYQPYPAQPTQTITFLPPAAPTECSGDIHVFPCPKCGECKCGKAKLAR